MKDFILLIVAVILFLFLGLVGFVYTAIYYVRNEKEKDRSYCFRLAFGIDCFACISMGELTCFGTITSISACIGESIVLSNFNLKYEWFNKLLDFLFQEKNHCVNAYIKEIL